jgi:ABC-type phosphate transport system auxiliary subunit
VIAPAAQTAAPADDSGSSWPWIAAGATGVAVLLGVGALWRTRHRPAGHTG